MTGDRLTALETAFLQLDRAGTPIHIGAVSVLDGASLFDGGELRLDDLRDLVRNRLDLLPQLRQRVRWPTGGIGWPHWEDDPRFDVADHVDVTVLAGAGDEHDLRRFAAELYARPLRADRPLWDLRFVVGLPEDRVAVVQRIHHALVDGVAGVELAMLLFDPEPHDRPTAPPAAAVPAAPPRRSPIDRVAGVAGALRQAWPAVRGLATAAGGGLVAPSSSLNATVGPARELWWVRTDLEAVKAAARRHGVKGNDVVLAAVAAGVRELLIGRREAVPGDARLRVLVPVSRHAGAGGGRGNRVSAMLTDLPVGIGDPVARLLAVARTTAALKASGEPEAGDALLRLGDALPAVALGLTGPVLGHQPLVNLVVTNVPGPASPLYVLGARSLEAFPFVPIAGNLTLGVAVLSYAGALALGVTVDPVACPDAEAFVRGLEAGFATLGASWVDRVGAPAPGR